MAFSACNSAPKELPMLGEKIAVKRADGTIDSIAHQLPDYKFIDQDSGEVTPELFKGKVYVADFFFTSCPTMCPRVQKQMMRVYERYKTEPRFMLLSHTIDTKHDSVAVLHRYAQNLGIETAKWRVVTGEKDEIYDIAKQYLISATEDENEPGGYTHSGAIILMDGDRHIRGYYDGTNEEKVDQLIEDIARLLKQ